MFGMAILYLKLPKYFFEIPTQKSSRFPAREASAIVGYRRWAASPPIIIGGQQARKAPESTPDG
jgi:hypothetical protein